MDNLRLMFNKNGDQFIKKEEYNLIFNKNTLKQWESDLVLNENEDERLSKKIAEVLDKPEQTSKNIIDLFVTKDHLMMRSYWERKFDKVEYLESYLDTLVELFLSELDLMNTNLDKMFFKSSGKLREQMNEMSQRSS